MRELLLLRHGESQGNAAALAADRAGAEVIDVPTRDADVALSSIGVGQSQAFGQALASLPPAARPQAAWCSPYLRAMQSLEIALTTARMSIPVRADERLRDRELGVLDRLTMAGVAARYPEEVERRAWLGKFYHRPPGGESWADVALRVRSAMADVDRFDSVDRLLVMCHDAVVMLIRYVCEGLTESQVLQIARDHPVRNLSVTRLERAETSALWQVVAYNDVSHLEQAGAAVTHHPGVPDARTR